MNIYPPDLEPTMTVPDSETAAGEREAGYFGAALWPAGYPGRSELLRLRNIRRHARHHTPSAPQPIIDRETGQVLSKPTSLSRIGKWTPQPQVKR